MTTGINFTLTGVGTFRTELNNLIILGKQFDQVFKQATASLVAFQNASGRKTTIGLSSSSVGAKLSNPIQSTAGLVALEKAIIRAELNFDKLKAKMHETSKVVDTSDKSYSKLVANINNLRYKIPNLTDDFLDLKNQTSVTTR